jgi:hypothetical protein
LIRTVTDCTQMLSSPEDLQLSDTAACRTLEWATKEGISYSTARTQNRKTDGPESIGAECYFRKHASSANAIVSVSLIQAASGFYGRSAVRGSEPYSAPNTVTRSGVAANKILWRWTAPPRFVRFAKWEKCLCLWTTMICELAYTHAMHVCFVMCQDWLLHAGHSTAILHGAVL